jgi:hypothetical protein
MRKLIYFRDVFYVAHCQIYTKGMIIFYPELIENRGGISILHHFKERLF